MKSKKHMPLKPSQDQTGNKLVEGSYKIYFLGISIGIILGLSVIMVGWFLNHQDDNYNPYQVIKGYESSRQGFLVKSSEVSLKMTDRALKALKNKNLNEAIDDCKIAIDLFPINAKPYILLAKIYLMIGQENKMYDVLTLAGHSYPNFDSIVSIIDDENLNKIPLSENTSNVYVANFPENKKMAVSFMFDDGESNVYQALPAFDKYGYKATIPVVPGFVVDKSNDPFWGSWAEWRDAANRGFEIANHSMYHRDSKSLHAQDFDISIDQAHDMIEKNIGHKVETYVFPHDSYTPEAVQRALRQHAFIRTPEFLRSFYERTTEIVIGGPHVSEATANRLVDIAINRRLWLIFKCHGVTSKRTMRSFKSITPEFLAHNLAYIHAKEDEVQVDTFARILNYIKQRKDLNLEIKVQTPEHVNFILHAGHLKTSIPMTVVVKIPAGRNLDSAHTSKTHVLKAWTCGPGLGCVDTDTFDQPVDVWFK